MTSSALVLAKKQLDLCQCTLVIVSGGMVKECYKRGVADLVETLAQEPELLAGASVADKVIGKAAAALMIDGGVAEAYARVATTDAIAMFEKAGIELEYQDEVPMVRNRNNTDRCPLDAICSQLEDVKEMRRAICDFLNVTK